MRKLAILAVLASTAMATPALARNNSWYIGVEGGAMIVEKLDIDIGALNNAATARQKAGYDVDGIIGYDFGAFRLEAEAGYRQSRLRSFSSQTTVPSYLGTSAPAGTYNGAEGKTSALSFMINGLLDFGSDDGISGYVGGGAGVARVKLSDYAINPNASFLNDSDTGFAYQAIAGVRAPLTDHVDVGLKYRFFNAGKVNLVDSVGRANETRFRSHSILGSLIYNFGEPAAPPPPPPPPAPAPEPAPPPPPVAAVCTPGPYIVFFEWNKSDITAEAASILDNAVTAYGDCGQAQVMLAGYTDTSGTPKYNLGLSQRRADAVSAYISSKGVPAGVITSKAFGETNLRVQTADGVRELQNRRVEITYGPGSGN
ncbi:OmpA family protein [Sphingomonas sp.]|uniref:OmpA family protein n=1 Tax=Sphingomonas sp. TaxID=28214 RepID=UPI0025FCC826|nr:OmpA family protein [Sphingomonas sp.]